MSLKICFKNLKKNFLSLSGTLDAFRVKRLKHASSVPLNPTAVNLHR